MIMATSTFERCRGAHPLTERIRTKLKINELGQELTMAEQVYIVCTDDAARRFKEIYGEYARREFEDWREAEAKAEGGQDVSAQD